MQQKRRSGTCQQCGDTGSGLDHKNEAAGSKREGGKEDVRCEVLQCQEESRLSEELNEVWCEEAVEDGPGPCESVGKTGC